MTERATAIPGVKHPKEFDPNNPPGFIEGHHSVRKITEGLAGRLGHLELTSESKDHLEEGRALWKSGMKTWVMARHSSDLDGPLIGETLGPEMSRAAFFLMGGRVLKRHIRGFFAHTFSQVPIPQKADSTKDVGERNAVYDLGLLKKAWKAIPALLENGRIAKLFLEGSRSRDGQLQPVVYESAAFLDDNTVVMPMAFIGASERWPVEKFPRFISSDKVTANVGAPVLIRDIIAEISEFKKRPGVSLDRKGKEEQGLLMEAIMRRGIAPLVAPEDRNMYSEMDLTIEQILPIVRKRLAEEAAAEEQRKLFEKVKKEGLVILS
jgi:1-acyl-sn-glycerol-3-phosphate acyltransferase